MEKSEESQKRIGIICVNYENSQEGRRFLSHVARLNFKDLVIVMVDNSTDDMLTPQDVSPYPWARLLVAGSNLGYWSGFMFGLSYLMDNHGDFDWLILSNPDIEFEPEFFEHLAKMARQSPLILAPSIISGKSGEDQNPYMIRRPSSRRMYFYQSIFSHYLGYFLYDLASSIKKGMKCRFQSWCPSSSPSEYMVSEEREGARIYAPHGSLIVFSPEIGPLIREWGVGPFLFCEEVFLGENCRQQGIPVFFSPVLKARHQESTTMRLMPSKKIGHYKGEANRMVYERYFR